MKFLVRIVNTETCEEREFNLSFFSYDLTSNPIGYCFHVEDLVALDVVFLSEIGKIINDEQYIYLKLKKSEDLAFSVSLPK